MAMEPSAFSASSSDAATNPFDLSEDSATQAAEAAFQVNRAETEIEEAEAESARFEAEAFFATVESRRVAIEAMPEGSEKEETLNYLELS